MIEVSVRRGVQREQQKQNKKDGSWWEKRNQEKIMSRCDFIL